MSCPWCDGIAVFPQSTNDFFSAITVPAIALMWPYSIRLQPLITSSDQCFTPNARHIMSTTSAISLFHDSHHGLSNLPTSNIQLYIFVRPLRRLLVISFNVLLTTLQTDNNDNPFTPAIIDTVGEHLTIAPGRMLQVSVDSTVSNIPFIEASIPSVDPPELFSPIPLSIDIAWCVVITEWVKKRNADVNWNTSKAVISSFFTALTIMFASPLLTARPLRTLEPTVTDFIAICPANGISTAPRVVAATAAVVPADTKLITPPTIPNQQFRDTELLRPMVCWCWSRSTRVCMLRPTE